MRINGDFLVKILSRPEWDDEVQEMLEFFEEDRVIVDPEYGSEDIYIEKYDIKLEFSLFTESKKQRAEEEKGNTYFQSVSFPNDCKISFPFDLKLGDSTKTCIEKISKKVDNIRIFRFPLIDSLLIDYNNEKFMLKIKYDSKEERSLINLLIRTHNIKMDLNKNYTPVEISLKQALKD